MLNCEDISGGGEQAPVTAESCVFEELKEQDFMPTVLESSMPSIIRIKRKLKDDPAQALLISCKRKKLESKSNAAQSAPPSQIDENLFHFATTVKMMDSLDKEDRAKVKEAIATRMKYTDRTFAIRRHQKKNSNDDICFASLKNELKSVTGQKRTMGKETDTNSQPQISDSVMRPAKQRFIAMESSSAKVSNSEIAEPHSSIVSKNEESVEDILCNSVKMIREKLKVSEPKDEYVVDVYYCSKELDWKHHDILNIQRCKYEEFVWDLSDDEEQQYDDDEDDSNDEGNWRNDYPDEEDSIDDDDRRYIYDEEECKSSDDCDVRDRDYYEGGYCDFEHVLDDYNPHANYDDFPALYESENEDDDDDY